MKVGDKVRAKVGPREHLACWAVNGAVQLKWGTLGHVTYVDNSNGNLMVKLWRFVSPRLEGVEVQTNVEKWYVVEGEK